MSGIMASTGGSLGIGGATARLAAGRGYDVAINDGTRQAAAEAVAADAARAQVRAISVRRVAKESDVVRLFETVDAELGRPTALVNNAGTVGPLGGVEDVDGAALKAVFELNVIGCFLCARDSIRRMSTRHGGQGGGIVNVSSIAARLGNANMWIHYAASKAALDTFTFGLAREVGPDGIRVNAVAPGLIDTEIHEAAGGSARYPSIVQETPLGVGTPEDVAEAILYLLADAASFVTGT